MYIVQNAEILPKVLKCCQVEPEAHLRIPDVNLH